MEKAINECDFCAIDTELSGVMPYKDLNSLDTPKSRYQIMKKVNETKKIKRNKRRIYE